MNVHKFLLVGLALVGLCGCARREPELDFRKYYQPAQNYRPERQRIEEEQLLTLSVNALGMNKFLRIVSDKTGLTIVSSSRYDDEQISMELKNATVTEALGVAARKIDADLVRVGSVYYIGKMRNEDSAVMVRKVRRLSPQELKIAVAAVLTDDGSVEVFQDGVAVISDTIEVLSKVEDILSRIETAETDLWVCQLWLITGEERDFYEVGLSSEVTGALSFELFRKQTEAAIAAVSDSLLNYSLVLESLLKLSRETDKAALYGSPLVVLMDGEKSRLKTGQTVPIPRKSVSPEGTVETVGYDYKEVGLILDVAVRSHGVSDGLLKADLELSSITGYVSDAPITSDRTLSTSAVMTSGAVYLLGKTRIDQGLEARKGILGTYLKTENSERELQLWGRIYKIKGQADTSTLAGLQSASPEQIASRPEWLNASDYHHLRQGSTQDTSEGSKTP